KGAINQFLGSHSYLMAGTDGQEDLVAGDTFSTTAANGSISRMEVLALNENQRAATVRLTYTPASARGHAIESLPAVRPSASRQTTPNTPDTKGSDLAPEFPTNSFPASSSSTSGTVPKSPAIFVTSTNAAGATNLVFDQFLPDSLHNLTWTNMLSL